MMQSLPPMQALPKGGLRAAAERKEFEHIADAVLMEWLKRKKENAPEYGESPNAWFKRIAYELLLRYVEDRTHEVFRYFIRKDRRSSTLIEAALKNPFKLGLLAMCADDSSVSPNDRTVFGNQMFYSWCHDVPPRFLNGFIAVSGRPSEIARKIKECHIEPGFNDHFVLERWKLAGHPYYKPAET